jgi:hypothetical protein
MAMTVAEDINSAISKGDIRSIRLMMKNSLLVDHSFAEFDEMTRIAGNFPGLYDEHDGRELNSDKTAWNEDYMDNLMVQVVGNFSHERLDHLKKVVRYLRPVAAPHGGTTSTGGTKEPPRGPSTSEPFHYPPKKEHPPKQNRGTRIAAGSAVGAVAGGVIAGIAGGSILIGAAAAAILAGVAVSAVTKGEKRDE